MVALIRAGVAGAGGIWADLGAGTGNFTWALRELLDPQGTIYAVDRDARAVARQRDALRQAAPGARIVPIQADLTQRLELPPLDGVLMANALHFIRDQEGLLRRVAGWLRPGGRLVLVEYDTRRPIPWVPFPVPSDRFPQLAAAAGLTGGPLIGTRRSPSSGSVMYAGLALRPE